MWKSRVIVMVAGLAVLTGCSKAGGNTGSGTTSSAPSSAAMSEVEILALAKEVMQCVRNNGLPGAPDPYFENGELKLPPVDESVEQQGQAILEGACNEIWQRLQAVLPEAKGGGGERQEREAPHALTPEELEKLKEFTNCLREHGMTKLGDPDGNGQYHLGASGYPEGLGKGERPEDKTFRDALDACEQFHVNGSGFEN
jgi:hypothetical protein